MGPVQPGRLVGGAGRGTAKVTMPHLSGQSAWCCSPSPTSPWVSCVCGMQESPCPPLDLCSLPGSDMCSVSVEGSRAIGLMELVGGEEAVVGGPCLAAMGRPETGLRSSSRQGLSPRGPILPPSPGALSSTPARLFPRCAEPAPPHLSLPDTDVGRPWTGSATLGWAGRVGPLQWSGPQTLV